MKKIMLSLISLLLLLILPSCGESAFSATECNNFREYEKLLADPRLPENFVRYESLSSAGTFQSLKLNDTLENMLSNEEECLGYTYTLEDKNGEIIPITVLHHSNGCSHQFRETLDFKYLCTRDEWTIGQYWYAVEELPLSSYDFNEEDLDVGVRETVEADNNKKNKADFVLWFTKSKFDDQELKWDSPFGVGYPGWHIECSCIARKHLGEYLDLHCGGIDNAFPHHTNEIAQSESTFGHEWCKYWFHVHHLNTQGGKMSKSKGEFLTVSLLEERGFDPLVYRLFCLGSHYRKNLVFSWENLENAKTAYNKLVSKIATLKANEGDEIDESGMEKGREIFKNALDNDLNTSLAVTALYDALKLPVNDKTKLALIAEFDTVLGLDLIGHANEMNKNDEAETSSEADSEFVLYIKEKIAARAAAKKAKNFAEADAIRAELLEKGVTLVDKREGTEFIIG